MEISQNFVAFSEYMNFNEKDTLQHFQIHENRIRTFVVSVFDLMSLLYVMNSPTYSTVYLCIAKIEWRVERRKKSLNWNWRASTYVALGDLYPHCHKLKVVSGTWFSM